MKINAERRALARQYRLARAQPIIIAYGFAKMAGEYHWQLRPDDGPVIDWWPTTNRWVAAGRRHTGGHVEMRQYLTERGLFPAEATV